jgi:hypothetical protein
MPENDTGPQISDDEFLAAVSPRDLHGRINLRIEKSLQHEIENIAEDSRYPLNSSSEVVRYCCLYGLERLREWKPGPTLLGNIKAANALMARDKIQCETVDLLARLDERIDWYITNNYFDEAIDLVARVRAYFDSSEDFWASRIRSEIDAKFSGWLDQIDARRAINDKEGPDNEIHADDIEVDPFA